jgi:hypothetical protein
MRRHDFLSCMIAPVAPSMLDLDSRSRESDVARGTTAFPHSFCRQDAGAPEGSRSPVRRQSL